MKRTLAGVAITAALMALWGTPDVAAAPVDKVATAKAAVTRLTDEASERAQLRAEAQADLTSAQRAAAEARIALQLAQGADADSLAELRRAVAQADVDVAEATRQWVPLAVQERGTAIELRDAKVALAVAQKAAQPAPAASAAALKAVAYVKAHLGDDYVWAAEGPDEFDCSGLTLAAYKSAGIPLPHYSGAQAELGKAVTLATMKPGDLIFWYSPIHHVSIYVGDGYMIHAQNPTVGVVKTKVSQWVDDYGIHVAAVRRIAP